MLIGCFFFSSRRRHTRWPRDWSSDVCSSDLPGRSGPWSLISVITEDQRTAPLLETSDEPPESSLIIALLSGSDVAAVAEPLNTLSLSLYLLVIALGLLLSAIFSGSEVAFFSLVNQMEELDREKSRGPDMMVIRMLEQPRRLLATILIGNTFANIITSVLAAVVTGLIAASFGLSEVLVFTIEIIALTFTILILGEITPTIIRSDARR